MHNRVELFGTLGPCCCSEEVLREMFLAGMDGCRLNLSHTSLEQSADWIQAFQDAAKEAGKEKPELLIDMQGPELRCGDLPSPLTIRDGGTVSVPMQENVCRELHVGDRILLDDGKLEARVEEVGEKAALLTFLRGGVLTSRKSVKIEGREVTGPALTPEDLSNLDHAREFGVTAVMEPFVNDGATVRAVRKALDERGLQDIRVFAKIENQTGLKNLAGIIEAADLVVIARGDLGNAVHLPELPVVQKRIARACREKGRDFMVVTQMLASMTTNPVPTRAEVSDICNAVLDGASSLMVTNETARGAYPVEVIKVLKQTSDAALAYAAEQALQVQ